MVAVMAAAAAVAVAGPVPAGGVPAAAAVAAAAALPAAPAAAAAAPARLALPALSLAATAAAGGVGPVASPPGGLPSSGRDVPAGDASGAGRSPAGDGRRGGGVSRQSIMDRLAADLAVVWQVDQAVATLSATIAQLTATLPSITRQGASATRRLTALLARWPPPAADMDAWVAQLRGQLVRAEGALAVGLVQMAALGPVMAAARRLHVSVVDVGRAYPRSAYLPQYVIKAAAQVEALRVAREPLARAVKALSEAIVKAKQVVAM